MASPISRYRFAWDPAARRGEVAFITSASAAPVRVPVSTADEFNALALMLKEPGVVWDGRILWSDSGATKTLSQSLEADAELFQANPNAKKIIDACEDEWPANKSDCSGFVRDVAGVFGVTLTGQANEIVARIQGTGWTQLADGKSAKQAADEGFFVVGGLSGDEQQTPSDNGHVVVVVSGPLAKDAYPTAYWGKLGGSGERAMTVNWAWKAGDRDRVHYASMPVD